jgi:hypothetical protein
MAHAQAFSRLMHDFGACELDDLAYFSVRMRMRFDPTRLWFWRDAFWATGLTLCSQDTRHLGW